MRSVRAGGDLGSAEQGGEMSKVLVQGQEVELSRWYPYFLAGTYDPIFRCFCDPRSCRCQWPVRNPPRHRGQK